MDAGRNSLELLSHFDGGAPPEDAGVEKETTIAASRLPARGIGWVLEWVAALAVLCYASTVLAEFTYCVVGEQLLARAARAGALEATLPRATVDSVEQSVWRRLAGHVASERDVKFSLLQNGRSVGKRLRPRGGDELSVTVVMPAWAIMPGWLRTFTRWRGDAEIEVRAERSVPDRKLISSGRR